MADVIITVYEKNKAIHTDLLYNRFCKISKKEFTEIEMKKKRTKLLVFFALAGILVLFYMIGESYCEGLSGGSSLKEKNEVMCRYKYDMIVDSPNSSFWQAVYDCAQEWAQKNDATLAGMLAFRGLSNVVLQGQTLAPMPDSYLALFNNYIPDFVGKEGFNVTCFAVGIIVCIVYVLLVMKNRADRAKKGYSVEAFGGAAVKMVLICAVVLAFMFRLAQYKGIPNSLVWVAVIIAIYTYIASKTTTGRYFYAVGGNEKATKLSGINTNKVYFLAYLNMGLLAAIAGMVTMARLNSANPQAGTNFEMDAIGSCFIGGASAYGGTGTVPGVIIGALLMGVLNLGMSIMGIDQNIQKVVKGLVLLAAVIFDVVSKRKSFIVK